MKGPNTILFERADLVALLCVRCHALSLPPSQCCGILQREGLSVARRIFFVSSVILLPSTKAWRSTTSAERRRTTEWRGTTETWRRAAAWRETHRYNAVS